MSSVSHQSFDDRSLQEEQQQPQAEQQQEVEATPAPVEPAQGHAATIEPEHQTAAGFAAVAPEEKERAPISQKEATIDWSKPMSFCMYGCFSYLVQLILTGCSGSFLFGINLSLLNTAINHITWELEWCDFMCDEPNCDAEEAASCDTATTFKAFLSTAVFIGAAIGSMTGGVFLGAGRRGMILLSLGVFSIGVVSGVVSNSFSALFWARLFTGYGVGLISFCVPTYLSEITPPAVRGFYGVFHQLFITIGILVGTLIGLPLAWDELPEIPDYDGTEDYEPYYGYKIKTFSRVWWRFMLGFCILPVLLCMYLLGRVYIFETPYYYVEKGLDADAVMLMRRICAKEDVSEEMETIRDDIAASQKAKDAGMNLSQAMKRPDYRNVIIFGCVLSAFQQFGGINVFIASSNALFEDAGLTGKMPTVMSNVMNLINCVMTLPAVPLIEKLGRKTLLLAGCIGMTIGVIPATICYFIDEDSDYTMWLAIIGCLVFIICFASTYGPILWVYLFEIYPTEIKGAGAGLATAVNWLAGIIMVFATNYIDNKIQYLIFTIMCGLSVFIVAFGMRETKGRPLGDSPFIKH